MKRLVVVLALFLGAVVSAQEHAPLPRVIAESETVYIVNDTGWPKIADKAYKELQAWGRFRVVDDPKDADLIFRFSGAQQTLGGLARANKLTMEILDAKTGSPIWKITEDGALLVSNNAKDCIKKLRKRMPKEK